MAYTRGVDVIGKSLMDALSGLGEDWANKINRDNQAAKTAPLIHQLFNPDPVQNTTYAPQGGRIQNPDGTLNPMSPTTTTTPGPPPWAKENTQSLIDLNRLDPTAAKVGMSAYQASLPTYSEASPGSQMMEHPAGGGVPFAVGSQVPFKPDTAKTTMPTQDWADVLDEKMNPRTRQQPGTNATEKLQFKYIENPITHVPEVQHKWSPMGTEPASLMGGAQGKYVAVKNAMGATTGYVNPNTKHYIDVADIPDMPSPQAPLSSSTKTMVESAPKVKDFVAKINPEIDKIATQLGPIKGRWNEFMTGKIGADNPEYTQLRTNVGLLSTLLMRMHVGARGGEYIMKHFEDMINQGTQSPANLKAAIGEINSYADQVLQEGNAGVPTGTPKKNDPMGIR